MTILHKVEWYSITTGKWPNWLRFALWEREIASSSLVFPTKRGPVMAFDPVLSGKRTCKRAYS